MFARNDRRNQKTLEKHNRGEKAAIMTGDSRRRPWLTYVAIAEILFGGLAIAFIIEALR